MAKASKFYITTAIAYVNAQPHIGFALELLQADVLARYHRLKEEKVWFLTGTDEHGLKVFQAAQAANKNVQDFVDENASRFQELTKVLNISNNDFIRTSDQKRHWPAVQEIWRRLKKKNLLYKKRYQGYYCVGHEAFIKSSELVNGVCPDHQSKPIFLEEENYFFKLSSFQEILKSLIGQDYIRVIPETRKNEVLAFIDSGLEDISVSREKERLPWGVPVPDDEQQVIYIWFEALINYISALGFGSNDLKNFEVFWPADVHIIGKDILRFHAVIWPAMLLAADLAVPRNILVHGFITVEGQKMSKSLGNVIDPFALIKNFGSEAVRYYLLREIPPFEDGDFSFNKFKIRYNADLANALGNLVSRLTTLGMGVELKGKFTHPKRYRQFWEEYCQALDGFRLNEGLAAIWRLIHFLNERVDKEKIWELKEKKPDRFREVYQQLITGLVQVAWMLKPYLPETAIKIFNQIGLNPAAKDWDFKDLKIQKGQPLFPRLE